MRVKALPQTDDVRCLSGAYFPFRGMYVQRNILSEEGVICAALSPALQKKQTPGVPNGRSPFEKIKKATVICSAQKSPCCAHAYHAHEHKQKIFTVFTKTACVSLAAPNISRNRQQPPYTTAANGTKVTPPEQPAGRLFTLRGCGGGSPYPL